MEIKTVTSIKRGENIPYLNSPKPDKEISLYDYKMFPSVVFTTDDNKLDSKTFNIISKSENETLHFATSNGWIIYALETNKDLSFFKVFDSGDICTSVKQFKERFC